MVEQHLQQKVLTEMEQRRLSPAHWQKFAQQLQMKQAPLAAWARNEAFKRLETKLEAAEQTSSFREQTSQEIDEIFGSKTAEVEMLDSALAAANDDVVVEREARERAEQVLTQEVRTADHQRHEASVQVLKALNEAKREASVERAARENLDRDIERIKTEHTQAIAEAKSSALSLKEFLQHTAEKNLHTAEKARRTLENDLKVQREAIGTKDTAYNTLYDQVHALRIDMREACLERDSSTAQVKKLNDDVCVRASNASRQTGVMRGKHYHTQ